MYRRLDKKTLNVIIVLTIVTIIKFVFNSYDNWLECRIINNMEDVDWLYQGRRTENGLSTITLNDTVTNFLDSKSRNRKIRLNDSVIIIKSIAYDDKVTQILWEEDCISLVNSSDSLYDLKINFNFRNNSRECSYLDLNNHSHKISFDRFKLMKKNLGLQ